MDDSSELLKEISGKLPHPDSDSVLHNVVNFLLYAAGMIAVVMIIVSALQLTASAGDAGAVTKAKRTLVYSIVGLVIVILALAIVNFVIGIF